MSAPDRPARHVVDELRYSEADWAEATRRRDLLAALAAGCATYVLLLNPLTYHSSDWYPHLTASLPAAASAALVYFLLGSLVRRAGRGGYPNR